MRPLLCLLIAAGVAFAFDVQDKSQEHKTYPGVTTLDIDNVNGSIDVTGTGGAEAQVDIEKTIHADDAERLETARREVKLDATNASGALKLYVDGPFRCHCEDGVHGRNGMNEHGHRGYRVDYQFHVRVPFGAKLLLRTINGGEIRVAKTTGDFDLDNINGGIEMTDVAGSGRVYALNGKVKVGFTRNPSKASYFGSLNGDVDVSFQPGLSADVRVKTFNGKILTDFPVTALPVAQTAPKRKNGRFLYRSNEFTGVRIGSGGPELKFENFNGTIRILNRGQL